MGPRELSTAPDVVATRTGPGSLRRSMSPEVDPDFRTS